MINEQLVADELTRNDWTRRKRLDDEAMARLLKVGSRRPRAIGRVGEDTETVGLARHQLDADRSVGSVRRGDLDAGVRLGA
ncbi:MAG: hypothetical protein ACYCST_16055 [Acidimicrobiales bacterium]